MGYSPAAEHAAATRVTMSPYRASGTLSARWQHFHMSSWPPNPCKLRLLRQLLQSTCQITFFAHMTIRSARTVWAADNDLPEYQLHRCVQSGLRRCAHRLLMLMLSSWYCLLQNLHLACGSCAFAYARRWIRLSPPTCGTSAPCWRALVKSTLVAIPEGAWPWQSLPSLVYWSPWAGLVLTL